MGQTEADVRMFAKMTLRATRSGSNLCVIFTARDAEVGHQSGRRDNAFRMACDEFVHHTRKAKLVGVADENGEGVAV